MCYESELRNSTKIKFIPYFGGELATAATAEQNPVDGGGDQWREVVGDEEDDPETKRGRAGCARAKSFRRISKNLTREYI